MKPSDAPVSVAVAHGVWQIVQDLKVKLVVVWSQTGRTARIFSKFRFSVPILALSADPRRLRQMALHYGVMPLEMPGPADLPSLIVAVERFVRARGFAAEGDRVMIVAGTMAGPALNGVFIHSIGGTTAAGGVTGITELERP